MPQIMVIAGTDSSGGAGLSRDVAVAAGLGIGVMPIVTAVTAQSHKRFVDSTLIPASLIAAQIASATVGRLPDAVKIGMLGSTETARAVADALKRLACPIVLDPVLKSSSGGGLMTGELPPELLSQTTLITPNLPEAAALTGRPVALTVAEVEAQARILMSGGARAVLVKGGHAGGAQSTDYLVTATDLHAFEAPRLNVSQRGTGCAMATAIACFLAQGAELADACRQAKAVVLDLLRN